ncbi:hypothetical protein LCGC14_1135850 [marine sediment metagenome]|uniref:Uncharacterized protein n=1 Tax=marine sediment metagenome TaxID=412755 RepID=A0A0F9LZU2_9ZZZZ
MMNTEEFDYEQLSPGIRNAVRWFHAWEWDTSDSGDGSLSRDGMECAMEVPMVVVPVEEGHFMCHDANAISQELEREMSPEDFAKVDIQAMYNPRDGIASILVTGDGLLRLKAKD